MRWRVSLLCLALAGCGIPVSETVGGVAGVGTLWQLDAVDGAPFPAPVTVEFAQNGNLMGQAPCNSFTARQSLPLPWFEVDRIETTRERCPELALEEAFFEALRQMEFAEIAGGTMLLSGGTDRSLAFRRIERVR